MPTKQYNENATERACFDEALAKNWYDSLLEEVNYHCTFCEALHMKVSEMETKVKRAYAATAESMEDLFDAKEIANRWLGLWYFASELLAAATTASEAHKICGADLSTLEAHREAAWERFQLHCPEIITCG